MLVDTGFGLDDIANPKRLGRPFLAMIRPVWPAEDAAVAQIKALGLDPGDVRHVLATHLDVDHAGGLPDFPDAEVHVFRPGDGGGAQPLHSREAPLHPRPVRRTAPNWRPHDVAGDEWMGFEAVRAIPGPRPRGR